MNWSDSKTRDADRSDSENGQRKEPAALADVDQLLDDLAQLAQQEIEPKDFYNTLIDRSHQILSATATAIWAIDPDGKLVLTLGRNVEHAYNSEVSLRYDAEQFGEQIDSRASYFDSAQGQLKILRVPLQAQEAAFGLLTFFFQEEPNDPSLALQISVALAEVASEYEKNRILAPRNDRLLRAAQSVRFSEMIHEDLSLQKVAFCAVNEGRVVAGCDRLTLIQIYPTTKILASSNAVKIDQRSQESKSLMKLARSTAKKGETIAYDSSIEKIADDLLGEYLESAKPVNLVLMPLYETSRTTPTSSSQASKSENNDQLPARNTDKSQANQQNRVLAILVGENFDSKASGSTTELLRRITPVTLSVRTALANSVKLNSIPLRPVWVFLGSIAESFRLRQIPTWFISTIIILFSVALLILLPADLIVETRGWLEPQEQQIVFAPHDGVIDKIFVSHGQLVAQDQKLFTIKSPELDLRLQQVVGKKRTTEEELSGLKIALNQAQRKGEEALSSQTAAKISALEETLKSIKTQIETIEGFQSELVVSSSLAGTISAPNLSQALSKRPVNRGETLLKVQDLTGKWDAIVDLNDQQVGKLDSLGKGLTRSVITPIGTPDKSYLGSGPIRSHFIKSIGRVQVAEGNHRYYVEVEQSENSKMKYGEGAIVKINCGRTSLIYSLFHDAIDTARRNWWW